MTSWEEGREPKELFRFSNWMGWKEMNWFAVTSGEGLAPSAGFLVYPASSHTVLWKTELHRAYYARCYLGYYKFTCKAGNSRTNVTESMYLIACLIKKYNCNRPVIISPPPHPKTVVFVTDNWNYVFKIHYVPLLATSVCGLRTSFLSASSNRIYVA
jgi:hypothetical protein